MDNTIEEIEVTDRKKRVWNKTQEEMTVGDAVKVQGTALAVFGTAGFLIACAPYAYDYARHKVMGWSAKRQVKKLEKALADEATINEG